VEEARKYFEQEDILVERERIQLFRESGFGRSHNEVEAEIREFLDAITRNGVDTRSLNVLFSQNNRIESRIADISAASSPTERYRDVAAVIIVLNKCISNINTNLSHL
jgi:hypothetical protein